MTTKTVIRNTPSGPIQLVFNGSELILQFNCECMHALPICHAICCRYRPYYNVEVRPDEAIKYRSELNEQLGLHVLQHDNGDCVYLSNDLCQVNDDKPSVCQEWHCSPEGKGEFIKVRKNGWVVLPSTQ